MPTTYQSTNRQTFYNCGRYLVTTLPSNAIAVQINGTTHAVPAGSTVAALLDWLEISSDKVAVELDKTIVRKRDWATASLPAGAQIEIVEFVGGG